MRQKIYKKSSAFWKHGKHKSVLPAILQLQEEREKLKAKKPKAEMYGSVRETIEAERKKRRKT